MKPASRNSRHTAQKRARSDSRSENHSIAGVEHLQLDLGEPNASAAPITGAVNGRAGPSRVGFGAGQKCRLARTHSDFLNATDDDRVATFALNRTAALHPARAALPHLENGGGVVASWPATPFATGIGGTERNAGPHWDETRTGCAMG